MTAEENLNPVMLEYKTIKREISYRCYPEHIMKEFQEYSVVDVVTCYELINLLDSFNGNAEKFYPEF